MSACVFTKEPQPARRWAFINSLSLQLMAKVEGVNLSARAEIAGTARVESACLLCVAEGV
jgi:hypothetical protein